MFIYEIKLLAKSENELETLISAVKVKTQDTGLVFGIKNYNILIMKSGKL